MTDRKNAAGEDLLDIEAVIYCEAESHKGIIIGKGGAMLKKVSTQARIDMERFLFFLFLLLFLGFFTGRGSGTT